METGLAVGWMALMFTVYAWHNGRATRKMLKELFSEMDERAEQRHREVMEAAEQRHKESMQQHQDVVELLKRGFGDLSRDVRQLRI